MNTVSISKKPGVTPALAIIVLALRRSWKKITSGTSLIAAGYADGVKLQREASRKYPFFMD